MLGNTSTTIWHPADDNGVGLGSTAYSFKDAYIQSNLKIGDTSGSTYFQFPTTIGTSGQILKVPSSGNTLEWSTGTGIPYYLKNNTLLVGHSTAPSGVAEYNVALGETALNSLTTGGKNIAIGYQAGTSVTEGAANILIGNGAGDAITTGGDHIAIGRMALSSEDTSTSGSIAIGAEVLQIQDGGLYNVGVGSLSLRMVTSGNYNIAVGAYAANALATGSNNIAIGFEALDAEDAESNNTAIGHKALNVQDGGDANVALGYQAGVLVSTGDQNTLIGSEAGDSITTGSENVIIGRRAAISAATNDNEIVIGHGAAGQGANKTVIGNSSTVGAHIYGLRTPVTNITADTSLTANDSGETFVFNDSAATLTLPDSGAGDIEGVYFNFIVLNDSAGTKRVQCADSTNEYFVGAVLTVDTDTSDANASFAAQGADEFDKITFDGTTTGRQGSKITVTNYDADRWHIEGTLLCTGSPATPFS
jgi:hypothetical protein